MLLFKCNFNLLGLRSKGREHLSVKEATQQRPQWQVEHCWDFAGGLEGPQTLQPSKDCPRPSRLAWDLRVARFYRPLATGIWAPIPGMGSEPPSRLFCPKLVAGGGNCSSMCCWSQGRSPSGNAKTLPTLNPVTLSFLSSSTLCSDETEVLIVCYFSKAVQNTMLLSGVLDASPRTLATSWVTLGSHFNFQGL